MKDTDKNMILEQVIEGVTNDPGADWESKIDSVASQLALEGINDQISITTIAFKLSMIYEAAGPKREQAAGRIAAHLTETLQGAKRD